MSQGLVCSPMRAARELGSERRETVWSISGVGPTACGILFLVREDRKGRTSGVPVIRVEYTLGSHVR